MPWCPTFLEVLSGVYAGIVYSFVFKVISLLLSLRFAACTAGVRPFPLAMQHFYSFVSHVVCLLLFSRFGACTAGIRPFPLSSISIHFCLPGDFCTSPNRLLLGVQNAFQKCPPCCQTACPPSLWLLSVLLCPPSCWSLPCLPSFFVCLRSCPPSCGSLCTSCLPFVSFCLPSC